MTEWLERWRHWLDGRARDGLLRALRVVEPDTPGFVRCGGHRCLDLSSNDYLGFGRTAYSTGEAIPAGSGASRLVVGDLEIHHRLERRLAELKGTEAALVFPSGYQANLGLLSALAGRDTVIVADRLIHASLVDGALLSGARLFRYPHRDIEAAGRILNEHRKHPCLLVTDAVFSMDGDIAPLSGLLELAERHGALLVVDEAHATGIMGPGGAGAWHAAGLPTLPETPVVLMGTLSKALGSQGGFVCGARTLIEFLVNRSRAFVYSTGIAPIAVHHALHAIDRLAAEPQLLDNLRRNTDLFHAELLQHGVGAGEGGTPILPVIVGDASHADVFSTRLEEAGILGVSIRPPTVPEGMSRVRFTVTAVHETSVLVDAARTIGSLKRALT